MSAHVQPAAGGKLREAANIQVQPMVHVPGVAPRPADALWRAPVRAWESDASQRLHALETSYRFRRAIAVRRFLQAYPHLVEFLHEARPYLKKHFGSELEVALEVVSDPEATDAKQLFAYIRTALPVDMALAQLDRLDEEWFLDRLDRVGGLFNFNLEIV